MSYLDFKRKRLETRSIFLRVPEGCEQRRLDSLAQCRSKNERADKPVRRDTQKAESPIIFKFLSRSMRATCVIFYYILTTKLVSNNG